MFILITSLGLVGTNESSCISVRLHPALGCGAIDKADCTLRLLRLLRRFQRIAIQQGRVNVLPSELWQNWFRGCWLQSELQVACGHGSHTGGGGDGQHLRRHAAIRARHCARNLGGSGTSQSEGSPQPLRQIGSHA